MKTVKLKIVLGSANANIEEFYAIDSDPPVISMTFMPPSMVSYWIPVNNKTPQRPSSILSMVPHCALLPNPGDCFISVDEAIK